MKKKISQIYEEYILSYPALVLVFLVLILITSLSNMDNFKLDASADTLILEDDKDLKLFREVSNRYKTNDFLVLTITDNNKDIFSTDTLAYIKLISEKISKFKNVQSITSIVNIPLVSSSNKPLTELINNVPNIFSDDINLDMAKSEILTSPVYKDLVISDDAKTTAMQILIQDDKNLEIARIKRDELFEKYRKDSYLKEEYFTKKRIYDDLYEKHNKQISKLIEEVRTIQKKYTNERYEIRLGGIPMITDDMITFIRNDLINFGIGVLIFILSTLVIIFKKLIWVIAPIINCVYSVLFMIGLLGFLDWKVTVISSNFISLMLILTLSMNIHIIVRYRQIYSTLKWNKKESVLSTLQKMVWPCLYTALTTIVAFASLIMSDIKPVIDFGYMMVFGLTTLFITSYILLPSLIMLYSNKDNSLVSNSQTKLSFTEYLARITIKSQKSIYIVFSLLIVITIYGLNQLKVENSFINYFRSNTEIYKGMQLIDNKLGGTTPMDVIIKFKEPDPKNEDDEFSD